MEATRASLDCGDAPGKKSGAPGLLDPVVIRACGDVRGRTVLDCGCREGRFSRVLLECGAAQVLGVDLRAPTIEAAKELAAGKDTYRVADVENVSFLGNGSFEVAYPTLTNATCPPSS